MLIDVSTYERTNFYKFGCHIKSQPSTTISAHKDSQISAGKQKKAMEFESPIFFNIFNWHMTTKEVLPESQVYVMYLCAAGKISTAFFIWGCLTEMTYRSLHVLDKCNYWKTFLTRHYFILISDMIFKDNIFSSI